MGHGNHGPVSAQPLDDLDDLGLPLVVKHGGCLVEDQHLGRGGKRPRDGDALLLAAREVVHVPVLEAGKPHLGQGARRRLARLGRGGTEVQGREGHVLAHDARDELVLGILEHHLAAAAQLVRVGARPQLDAGDLERAPLQGQQRVEMASERGLAAPVCAHDRHELALLNREGDVVERGGGGVVVGKAQVASLNHGHLRDRPAHRGMMWLPR